MVSQSILKHKSFITFVLLSIFVNIFSNETNIKFLSEIEIKNEPSLNNIETFFNLESIVFSGKMYPGNVEYSNFFFFIPDTVRPRLRVVKDKKSFEIQYPDANKYPETFKDIRSGVIKGTHSQFRDAFICAQDYSEFTFSMSKSVYEFSYLQIINNNNQLSIHIKMFISWQNPTRALFVNYNFDRKTTSMVIFNEFVEYLKSLNPKAVVD